MGEKMTQAEARDGALRAFNALCSDVEQFDNHPPLACSAGSGLFSERVPIYMKSYLVNWLRRFASEHGQSVRDALTCAKDSPSPISIEEIVEVLRAVDDDVRHQIAPALLQYHTIKAVRSLLDRLSNKADNNQ
jgi:hypothetical protein